MILAPASALYDSWHMATYQSIPSKSMNQNKPFNLEAASDSHLCYSPGKRTVFLTFSCFLLCVETVSCYVAHTDLKFVAVLPPPLSKDHQCKPEPQHLTTLKSMNLAMIGVGKQFLWQFIHIFRAKCVLLLCHFQRVWQNAYTIRHESNMGMTSLWEVKILWRVFERNCLSRKMTHMELFRMLPLFLPRWQSCPAAKSLFSSWKAIVPWEMIDR